MTSVFYSGDINAGKYVLMVMKIVEQSDVRVLMETMKCDDWLIYLVNPFTANAMQFLSGLLINGLID
jgi:hypothetical protein